MFSQFVKLFGKSALLTGKFLDGLCPSSGHQFGALDRAQTLGHAEVFPKNRPDQVTISIENFHLESFHRSITYCLA